MTCLKEHQKDQKLTFSVMMRLIVIAFLPLMKDIINPDFSQHYLHSLVQIIMQVLLKLTSTTENATETVQNALHTTDTDMDDGIMVIIITMAVNSVATKDCNV